MKRTIGLFVSATACLTMVCQQTTDNIIVETEKYVWKGDSIIQDEFVAYAPDSHTIISNYKAQPGYFMPIEGKWTLKNDISAYPLLKTDNTLHAAIYNMGLDEMVNAVEPDSTLRTGKEWSGVWTRDVSYSIILSMAQMQPEVSKISLRKKITPDGRIVQDTGSGGAWPVSTDRMIWAVAAWEIYKATGDKAWLEEVFPVIQKSLADDSADVISKESGLVKGETSFIDWREQSYPKWMQTADIYNSEALGTTVVHIEALDVASKMAEILGYKELAVKYQKESESMADALQEKLWMPDKGYHAMYNYGRIYPILNPRAESLGESLAVLFDAVSPEQAEVITENMPITPFGVPVFFPQISDMPPYHNNALWPFVASYWALANAKAGNEQGLLEAIGSIYRPAALFATNKENLVLDNGDIATELNSSNMLWSLSGNLAITNRILFGINLEKDGIEFQPVVPQTLATDRTLENYPYRGKTLDITVKGWGNKIKQLTLNGNTIKGSFIPADKFKDKNKVVIEMANEPFKALRVNHTKNVKAPLTPIAWIEENGSLLRWNPIEYISKYVVIKDGERIAETNRTSYNLEEPGEYMVIGVAVDGTESFASEPRNNFHKFTVEIPGENTTVASPEISYVPRNTVTGFHGEGFREIDHNLQHLEIPVNIRANGYYALNLTYSNGNGPVNTENKCAIRSVVVDGHKEGIFVMPQRGVGNWDDWGDSNTVKVYLTQGDHIIDIAFLPEDENMNIKTNHALIDRLVITKLP